MNNLNLNELTQKKTVANFFNNLISSAVILQNFPQSSKTTSLCTYETPEVSMEKPFCYLHITYRK